MKPSAAPKKNSMIVLYIIIYATMFLFGLIENVKGVSYPLIKAEFGVNYDSQGGLVSTTILGYVLFCLIASIFLHRYGIKRSILAGYLAVCVGAVAAMVSPSFWTAAGTLLIVNAGFGFFEVGANALASVVFTSRAALMMNLMHFFYGFGAIAGPKAAGILTDTFYLTWRQVYLMIILPTAAVALFIMFTRFRGRAASKDSTGEETRKISFRSALKNPVVWIFCLTLGFMEVFEFGAANWGGLYLKDIYGLDPRVAGASFVSLFYIQFTIARLFGGLIIEKAGYMSSLIISVIGTMAVFLIGFLLGAAGIWVLPTTGLFIGIMWPTLMAVAMRFFGSDAPTMTSVIITISGAVNALFQLVIGLTNYYAGEAWGYRSCLVYATLTLLLLFILSARLKQPYSSPAQ
ncbi:MAG: MFS transporter [Anaerolineaceae bacterium]|nr:MFS transporter [Anaerolineaceae bacterium]